MSDLFYPQTVSGDQYNIAILDYVPQLKYSISHEPNTPMAVVYEALPPTANPTFKTEVPSSYYEHLRRFLWRYYLFSVLINKFNTGSTKKRIVLPAVATFLQKMVVMMDTVVEQLIMGCMEKGQELDPELRCQYFDDYLVTEFVVGRHDPESVEAWRRKPVNRIYDLEWINPDRLNWAAYDAALGLLLGGETHMKSVDNIKGQSELMQLLDAVDKPKLVDGCAGMGLVLLEDGDGVADAEVMYIQSWRAIIPPVIRDALKEL
ncbi:hypothetical protein BU15DRAFT_64876 [Melanogaster broomeanus]|nr:hypothetical protein BU15DRAFT_64876 [Melanogaster broomeanus]